MFRFPKRSFSIHPKSVKAGAAKYSLQTNSKLQASNFNYMAISKSQDKNSKCIQSNKPASTHAILSRQRQILVFFRMVPF
jgi:hypothetical protein